MMQIAILDEKLAFAPQIQTSDLATLADYGFEVLICNRPDNEEAQQPTITEITTAAQQHGMQVVFAPICNSQFSDDMVDLTTNTLNQQKKTLMFCHSGTRSIVLWIITQLRQGTAPEMLFEQARSLGYDLTLQQAFIMQYGTNA